MEAQQDAFSNSAAIQRDTDYFRENISNVLTAEDLVADRRLLSVALGAFGLDEDINNKFFIQKVFEDGVVADDALANRLSDKRYFSMSLAFGLGPESLPRTGLLNFPDEILARYEQQQFARAVGDQNDDMRLALNVDSSLGEIIENNTSQDARWFSVMGNAPLRRVFETALGLPASIAAIDIDQQLDNFKSRSESVFGTDDLSEFADPDKQEDLIRLFLIRSEAAQFSATPSGSVALTLLQQIN